MNKIEAKLKSTINSRIYLIIEYYKLNPTSFSKKIGLSNNVTIGNIVGGRYNKPSFDVLEKILLTFESVNSEWLLTGNGEMLKSETNDSGAKKDVDKNASENAKWIEINILIELLKNKDEQLSVSQEQLSEILVRLKISQEQLSVSQEQITKGQAQIDEMMAIIKLQSNHSNGQ